MARILLVEDEENLCLLYQAELGMEGHEVTYVRDGKSAVEVVRNERPDLVIMDLSLPEKMDGLESMSRILSEDKSIPVIINTGYSQYRDNFLSWAAEAYVVKSADLSHLKETINKVLGERQKAAEDAASGSPGTDDASVQV